ncbi:MAG TPA: hypothetical protein VE173_00180, partial [Longimicrobiales bacterium]|nr:hypothetical protein [Longimicrobiales bacterium]
PDQVTCVRCLEVRDQSELDRLLWCDLCRNRARARATRRGWIAGTVLAGLLALWIWLVIRPSDLVIGGWVATVVATFWIGSRIAREIAYGVERYRNRRAVEAVPPSDPSLPEGPDAATGGPPTD